MGFYLLLAFVGIPLVEIYLIMVVSGHIGAWPTVGLVVLTGVAGAWLARAQGVRTLLRVRDNVGRGVAPAEEMIDAVIILAAGVVLLAPGFLTDLFGLALLIPYTRKLFKQWLRRKFDDIVKNGRVTVTRFH